MRLLLFGGTFDPPHVGHMNILQNAIEKVVPDEVWVMPAGVPPHKRASATPAEYRLEMCECFRSLFPNMVVSDWEIRQEGKSYTLNTVEWLQIQRPSAEIFLCIGSDMLLSFTTWHCWEALLQKVILVVQSRQKDDEALLKKAADALQAVGGKILFTHAKAKEISSTQLREQLAKGKDVWCEIPAKAAEIIRANGLYRAPKSNKL